MLLAGAGAASATPAIAPTSTFADALANRKWQGIPGLERTPKGRLFFTWFTGGAREPKPENMVILCYSDDDGKTLSPLQIMATARNPASAQDRAHDGVLWIDPKGRLWLLFDRSDKTSGVISVHARICENPDAPVPVFGDEFRLGLDVPYAAVMTRATVLSSGEWLQPVFFVKKQISNKPSSGWWPHFDKGDTPPVSFGAAISSDEGKTWKVHADLARPWGENMIVELKDGRFWMPLRTATGVLWETFSPDKGRTWSEVKRSHIENPDARFFLRRLSSGNLLLVNYHKFDRLDGDPTKGIRSRLTAQISTDDGKTWNEGLLLDERQKVSYPDGVQDKDGVIWILYDRDRRGDADILLARFREEDVIAGKNVSGAVVLRQVINSIARKSKPAE